MTKLGVRRLFAKPSLLSSLISKEIQSMTDDKQATLKGRIEQFAVIGRLATPFPQRQKKWFRGKAENTKYCFYLVGDAGLEPTAFGSGDQRSIQLS
jgi:hypothetical protein